MEIRSILFLAAVGFIAEICYGSTCSHTYASRYRTKVCADPACWTHREVHKYRQSVRYSCCPGYIGSDCNTPVCAPACKNNGRCVSPNHCECPEGTAGQSCEQTFFNPPGGRGTTVAPSTVSISVISSTTSVVVNHTKEEDVN